MWKAKVKQQYLEYTCTSMTQHKQTHAHRCPGDCHSGYTTATYSRTL